MYSLLNRRIRLNALVSINLYQPCRQIVIYSLYTKVYAHHLCTQKCIYSGVYRLEYTPDNIEYNMHHTKGYRSVLNTCAIPWYPLPTPKLSNYRIHHLRHPFPDPICPPYSTPAVPFTCATPLLITSTVPIIYNRVWQSATCDGCISPMRCWDSSMVERV